jgi:hypothetical protein
VGNFSEGASLQGGAKHGAVFTFRVQTAGHVRVSRYKLDASDIIITGYKFYELQWRRPGLSPIKNLSWVQE